MLSKFPRTSVIFFAVILPLLAHPQKKDVTIRIVQDDDVVISDLEKSSLLLQKKTFRIQVLLQNIKGVYAFASLNDSLFRLPDTDPVPGFATLPDMVVREDPFNKEKELIVSRDNWSYWFYDPGTAQHPFNRKVIVLDSGRVVGSRTIKHLYIIPDRLTIKLKDINEPLYLLFVAVDEEDDKGRPLKELLRKKIKIEWREED
ncbi:MAG TPA: hypothetical protein VMZ03_09170 [Chitinophagaceae bacterium]|nr:hypothetical protein [Chitinophagaceae bacterium]